MCPFGHFMDSLWTRAGHHVHIKLLFNTIAENKIIASFPLVLNWTANIVKWHYLRLKVEIRRSLGLNPAAIKLNSGLA